MATGFRKLKKPPEPIDRRASQMKEKKVEEKLNEPEKRRETYEFTAFVSGPLISYEIKAKDFDEAYGTGMRLLMNQLKRYKGEVEIGKIHIERWTDNF